MTKSCRQCTSNFEVTDSDLAFYEKISPVIGGRKHSIPPPSLCPPCRDQRRMAQVNQVNLFERQCDATGAAIISNYPPDSSYKVYDQKYWYSDGYETQGQAFDFKRPFFEQFQELSGRIPRPALFTDFLRDENSAYTNYAGKNKNCYLIFDSDENWDCYYSYGINGSKDSMDCYRAGTLELCYEAVDSKNCYNCAFITNSEHCTDSLFLRNCTGCKNCIMCSNLHQKEYHIDNRPVSKEKYEQVKKQLESHTKLEQAAKHFDTFRLKFPQKYMRGFQNENVSGDYLVHSKNALECYDSMHLWDGKYSTQVFIKGKDFMDSDECGDAELIYECNNLGYNAYQVAFSLQCLNQISDLYYCNYCFHSAHLFGCIGLKRKQYCILNQQYTKEAYEELLPKIIEHMRRTEEWGEYFPMRLASFPYNLTMAQDYYPLTREEALQKGSTWREEDQKEYQPQTYQIPDSIQDVQDGIFQELLACSGCEKNYKIIPQELRFYRQLGLPVPRKCFKCRHRARMSLRNPRKLYQRNCMKCGQVIQTTYAPASPEIVYCEACYQQAVY